MRGREDLEKLARRIRRKLQAESARLHEGRFPASASPNQVLFRINSETGNVSHYQRFDEEGRATKRVDLEGIPHGLVDTPHVQEFDRNTDPETGRTFVNRGTVRKARPEEIIDDGIRREKSG